VTTANLDGETNLKTISVPSNYVLSPEDGVKGKDCIVCEASTFDLYSFNGRLEIGEGPRGFLDKKDKLLSQA